MSEPIFSPAGQGAVATTAVPEPDAGTSRKSLFIIGGVGAALIIGAGAFFMLSSGAASSDPIAAAPMPLSSSAAPVAPSASPSPTAVASAPAPAPLTPLPKAAAVVRDPFKPLFVAGGSSNGSAATTPTPASVAPTPSVATVAPLTLTVGSIDLVAQTAVVRVDSKSYTVGIGVPFAQYFTLYSVFNSNCVGVLFGDQSIPVCTTVPQTVSP